MGQTVNQIENHIEQTRHDLGNNLHELESKVKSITDWKQQFRDNPMTMVGVAFGGGIVLATMLGGRKGGRKQRPSTGAGNTGFYLGSESQRHGALETWDNIKGALIGVAATRFKGFLGGVIPGFQEHVDHSQRENSTSLSNTGMRPS